MRLGTIKSSEIFSSYRFDSNFHLSEAISFEKTIKKQQYDILLNLTERIFTAGRTKRCFTSPENGNPYLSNSDVVKENPFETCKYVSKKYSYDDESLLKEGMIVTGRVGAIGQTAYVTKEFENNNAMGSDNVIRIVANHKVLSGFLYAFLVSKYGNTFFWKIASGGVQPYISEPSLYNIPVPLLTKAKQEKIHGLIEESANLRVNANNLLNKAEVLFNNLNQLEYPLGLLHQSENHVQFGFSIKYSKNFKTTIKAKNYSWRVEKIIEIWNSKPGIKLKDWVDQEGLVRGMGGFFKRTDDPNIKGIEIVSQSDIHELHVRFKKVINRKINESEIAVPNMIIMPAAGNASDEGEIFVRPQLIYKNFEGKVLSEVIGKLRCHSISDAAYLYIALKSLAGFRILRSKIYGTSLRYPNWELLKDINIPLESDDTKVLISSLVINAFEDRAKANSKEKAAIEAIEKEIESWQN